MTTVTQSASLTMLVTLIAGTALAQSIEGTATYRERMALPAAAVFEAVLEDVSRADAPAVTIAQTRLTSPGNPPIAFTIAYDPSKIVANHRYAVRAQILVDGNPIFATGAATAVITRGSPVKVALMLRRIAGNQPSAPTPSANLAGTSWQLVKFQGGEDKVMTPDDRTKYTIEFAAGGRLTARVDCNRGRGTWKSSGANQIEFGPLALTRAKCPPGSMHDHIAKQWGNIRSYATKDGHLFLSLMADGGIYEFEPVKAK
jgi:putative lipoprotein